jgi:hypothetical protein
VQGRGSSFPVKLKPGFDVIEEQQFGHDGISDGFLPPGGLMMKLAPAGYVGHPAGPKKVIHDTYVP